jgi:hypothetical protein
MSRARCSGAHAFLRSAFCCAIPILAGAALMLCAVPCNSHAGAQPTQAARADSHAARLAAGDVSVLSVTSPYTLVALNQGGIPLTVTVKNESGAGILVESVLPLFTRTVLNDRFSDYSVISQTTGSIVLMSGESHDFEFDVDVNATALTGADIRIDASVSGYRIDTYEAVSDSSADAPHHWIVTSELVTALAAVYETKATSIRSDDSLVGYAPAENLSLNTVHALNGGNPLANLVFDGATYYRIVVQITSSFDWDFEPKEIGQGFFAMDGASRCFGRQSADTPGIKELLLSDFFVPNEGTDPTDIVVAVTKKLPAAVPWTMLSDPWTDPALEDKTGEIGTYREIAPLNTTVDCVEGGADWEDVKDRCERGRYYLYELWLRPDLDWANGDTADVYLHIAGKPVPKDIEELHLRFRLVDDDSLPPSFSEFTPGVVPALSSFSIACKISDPSGVYDDGTGSEGQGVYLIWDDDGSLVDDWHEITMSSIGGGYFEADATIGPHNDGDIILYRVHAYDNDCDGGRTGDRSGGFSAQHAVQIVGSTYLTDRPGSLYPKSVYPAQAGVVLHLEFDNPMAYDILLHRSSTATFSDGIHPVVASLRNETLIPAGATAYPVAFDPVTVPSGFSAPDTVAIMLDLSGTYGLLPYDQSWEASEENRLVILEPRLRFEARAVPSSAVHPGDARVELLRCEVTNESPADVSLDSLIVSNVTVGSGDVPLNDADIGTLRLYRHVSELASTLEQTGALLDASARGGAAEAIDDHALHGRQIAGRPLGTADSLIALSRFEGGGAIFRPAIGKLIPAGRSYYYYVVADIDSFLACDGDSLDVEISSPDSVFVSGGAPPEFARTPLNSDTKSVIDGFMAFQLAVEAAVSDTLFLGDRDQPVLSFILPTNGYAPDILSRVSVKNFGDAGADALIERLVLWRDDGDGAFSPGADSLIGELKATGSQWTLSGLSVLLAGRQRFFVSADFELGEYRELKARFGIPADGIEFISGNDGPIDDSVIPALPQVLMRREIVSLSALGMSAGTRHAGDESIELLALKIHNSTLGDVTIDSLWVRGSSRLFACEPAKPIALSIDDGDSTFDPADDPVIMSAPWMNGAALFSDMALTLASGTEKILFFAADLDSFSTVDGDTLVVGLESQGDLRLTLGPSVSDSLYRLDASFPLFSAGGAVTDGMLAHQVMLYPHGDSTIVNGGEGTLVLDLIVPGNGCLDDTLRSLTAKNLGTAGPENIERFVLWRDTGDGTFDPLTDDSIAVFSAAGGMTYAAAGLDEPIPGASGVRLFVEMHVIESIEAGGTVRMAFPVAGIQVASGNDGPLERELVSPELFLIPVPDRVTLFTSMVGNKRVRPGEKHVLNLVLGMYNSYRESKILERLALLSIGSSSPAEIVTVAAFADSDDDGLFNPAVDSLIEVAQSSPEGYTFDDLQVVLEPFRSTLIFIAYDAALEGIRDSVRIDLQVSDKPSIGFHGQPVTVQGDFPLNSAGVDITDGMVREQMRSLPVASGRVSPGAHDVLCCSFVLPCNGTAEDVFEWLSVQNSGTAEPGQDIQFIKLWNDAGSLPLSFDSEDEVVSFLTWNGSSWKTISKLSMPVSCGGCVLHVTADIASTARDGKSIVFCVPINGITVDSGNDGPIDGSLCTQAEIQITTDPLLAFFDIPASVTKDQIFDVRLQARNVSDTTLHVVVPDSFACEGTGAVVLLSGPEPPAIDLAGKSDSSFVWSCRAQSTGEIVFRGRAKETGGSEESTLERSDTLHIEEIPDNVTVTMRDLSPVSLNRGQNDASMIETTVAYNPSSGSGAAVEFESIELCMTDETGAPLPVKDAVSKLQLKDESRVLCSVVTESIDVSSVTLALSEHVVLEPGDSRIFKISLDVPASASAQHFRLSVQSSGKLALVDGNSGAPVPFSGAAFPWSTSTVALNDPASTLDIAFTPRLPVRINRGQDDVIAFGITLANGGSVSAAPVSVAELDFSMQDLAGDSVDADAVLRYFRLEGDGGNTYAYVQGFGGSAKIKCVLQPPITVSTQVPVALTAHVGCLVEPSVAGFSIALRDTSDIAARDVNSGRPVGVAAADGAPAFPMSSGAATFFDPLRSVEVYGTGLLAERVMAGCRDAAAIRVIIRHPGAATESPLLCDGLSVRVLDEAGRALEPNQFLDVIRVRMNVGELASAYVTASSGSDIPVDFASPVLVEPGCADTLEVLFDLDAAPSPARFQMHVNAGGLRISDATDGRSIIDLVGSFPIASGIGRIIFPAAQVFFSADGLLPANIAAGEESDCMRWRFARRNESSGSRVFVERLVLEVLDEADHVVDPSRLIGAVRIEGPAGDIASSWTVENELLVIMPVDTFAVDEDEARECVLRIGTLAHPAVKLFSIRVAGPIDVSCRDEATGEAVTVAPDSGSFPFGSGRAALLAPDIETAFSNYPNPFVAGVEKTTITFYLPAEGRVSVRVFTITGEPVRTIIENEQLSAGLHQEYSWDGKNGGGVTVLNGVYYLLLKVTVGGREYTFKRKVALVQ